MRDRIEWVEPVEASQHAASERLRGAVCQSLLLLLGGVFATLWFAPSAAAGVGLILGLWVILSGIVLTLLYTASLRSGARSGTQCIVDARAASHGGSSLLASRIGWEEARSFEISDHPTLPGIRTLVLHREGETQGVRLHFREGQLDEAELRTFVEVRIAEPVAQRLMRRVKM